MEHYQIMKTCNIKEITPFLISYPLFTFQLFYPIFKCFVIINFWYTQHIIGNCRFLKALYIQAEMGKISSPMDQ